MTGTGDSAGRIARRVRIRGRVQGVGFRASTARQARTLGVAGIARNLADGSVEVLALGAPDAVEALIGWLRHGPPFAEVSSLQVEEADDPPAVEGFRAL